jgi:hypothetical protein
VREEVREKKEKFSKRASITHAKIKKSKAITNLKPIKNLSTKLYRKLLYFRVELKLNFDILKKIILRRNKVCPLTQQKICSY